MARNLVPAGGGSVAVLDFQDLRPGPPGYDLASLLNDSFFAPPELERRALASEAGRGVDELDYRRAVVQRGLKAVGTFLAFAARGKRRHLPLVEPTLARALAAAATVPETARAVAELGPALTEGGRAAALC
jgi:aminoglycoside/choline kinase family phosphotransferase